MTIIASARFSSEADFHRIDAWRRSQQDPPRMPKAIATLAMLGLAAIERDKQLFAKVVARSSIDDADARKRSGHDNLA